MTPQFGSRFVEKRDPALNIRGVNGRGKRIEQFAEAPIVRVQPVDTARTRAVWVDDHLAVM